MNLSRLAKTLLMATMCGAAIAACGDDDTGGGGGGGGGGGAGGGSGGGTGGGGGPTTVSINVRFAQLIPDPQAVASTGDAGTVGPNVRVCIDAGDDGVGWGSPIPPAAQSAEGIPPMAISAYSNVPSFPNVTSAVAVYLAEEIDALTPSGTTTACQMADGVLTPVASAVIDPAAVGLEAGGFYTALLTGIFNGSPAALGAVDGSTPCLDPGPVTCPGALLQLIADDHTTDTDDVTIRVVNGIPNSGDVELCVGIPSGGGTAPFPINSAEPLLPGAAPIGVGEVTDYVVRDPVTTAGLMVVAVQRNPAVTGDGGDPLPCLGGTIDVADAALTRAFGPIPTVADITNVYTPAMGAADAADDFAADTTITAFLAGVHDATPEAPGEGFPGTFIVPALDEPPPATP